MNRILTLDTRVTFLSWCVFWHTDKKKKKSHGVALSLCESPWVQGKENELIGKCL